MSVQSGVGEGFCSRHVGPSQADLRSMLEVIGVPSLEDLVATTLPATIRTAKALELPEAVGEHELLKRLRGIVANNRVLRSYVGMGYHSCAVPPVIQRNILENPGWYTQYTPYQAEIAQGRLEALLNFQTLSADLTGLPVANASMLDEGTAAAEAMTLCRNVVRGDRNGFFVSSDCHPQTIAVVETRAEAVGVEVHVGDPSRFDFGAHGLVGALLQYPTTLGEVRDESSVIKRIHDAGALCVVACDLLALTLLKDPGAMGADVAVGSAQRFGVPMGFGGPHAAFFATKEKYARRLPGRVVGVSRDARGAQALRLAMQTREQHIRREKATSNICTAQVLLAIMASMYAVYHGPEGLRRIAQRVRSLSARLRAGLQELGCDVGDWPIFDTLRVGVGSGRAADLLRRAEASGFNLRPIDQQTVGISLDETTDEQDVRELLELFDQGGQVSLEALGEEPLPELLARKSPFLTHPVFSSHHSETAMLRYMHRLEARDLALNTSMIPLGSCTMKLNATVEMVPVTWPELAELHPFAPAEQAAGYQQLFAETEAMLAEVTGFKAVSLQPNAGSQGELTGLLVIRAFHRDRGDGDRNVCLIPASAHGTNPASAVMAGMRVVVVGCDEQGNIDLQDLEAKAEAHRDVLAALMVTYPSTHGVFEASIREVCELVHNNGGQVYLDGANLNALVGLSRPQELGADVCHLNLHKTFAIPHGGGGPGMGPIAVAKHLAPFLPGHPLASVGGERAIGPVSAAPFGSPSIVVISWAYMLMMGADGLTRATQVAIANANYMARRLEPHYSIVFKGQNGRVAHEFIMDLRPYKDSAGVTVDDVAKRLMDYGFHAPTMSWPVAGTMMVEPTESESKAELDRFCDAMISIREEIRAIENGRLDGTDNPLKNAPHTAAMVSATDWSHPYPREQGAYPAPHLREHKYWPAVARIDNAFGDRNLVCSCPPLDAPSPPRV